MPGDLGSSPLKYTSLGDTISVLGPPNFLRLDEILYGNSPITYWFYTDRWLILNVEHYATNAKGLLALYTQDRLIGIGMGEYARKPRFSQSVKIAGWHGFASLNRYIGCLDKLIRVDCITSEP